MEENRFMTDDLTLNMDAYLPLRDVVFNTLREAILKGELKTRRASDGTAACCKVRRQPYTDP